MSTRTELHEKTLLEIKIHHTSVLYQRVCGYRKGGAYCLIYNVVKINSELKGKQGQQSFQPPKLIVTMLSCQKKGNGVG